MKERRFGICTHVWGQAPLERVLDEVAAVGYAGIELFDHAVAAYAAEPARFRRLLADRELRLASLYYEGSFTRDDQRETEVEQAVRAATFCAALDCDRLVVGPGKAPADGPADYGCMSRTLEAIGAAVQARGVLACFHPHAGSPVETGEQIARVFDATDPALVRFCVDTGHLARGGSDPVAITRAYLDRVSHVHLKDRHPGGRFTELGRGVLDNAGVLSLLRGVGYTGWILAEVPLSEVTAPTAAESAAIHLQWLRVHA